MRRSSLAIALALVAAAPLSCGKTEKSEPKPMPSEARSAFLPASAAASASAAPKRETVTWTVKYTLAPTDLYVADQDKKSVRFKNDTEKYVGDGTLSLFVDPDGRVTGASDSPPLGPTLIAGMLANDELTATVRRANPTDEGLTGTITAKVTGDKLAGEAKLAEFNAAVVREAKLTGQKK